MTDPDTPPAHDELSAALAALTAARGRNAVLEAELVDLRHELQSVLGDVQRLVVLDESTALLAEYAQDNWQLSQRLDDESRSLREHRDLVRGLRERVTALEASSSWRLTSPLRRVSDLRAGRRHA